MPSLRRTCTQVVFAPLNPLSPLRSSSSKRKTANVKSGSSGLQSDRGSGREIEVSHRGGPEVRRRYKSGGLSKDLA